MNDIRRALAVLANTVSPLDGGAARYVRSLKNESPQALADDVNIWGGSGSLVDRTPSLDAIGTRQAFEEAVGALASALVAAGARNARMESWANRESPKGWHDA